MRIAELSTRTGYSIDQARRRLNALHEEGVIQRERQTQTPRAWEYAPQTVELLRTLNRLEHAGCTCKEAIAIVAAECRAAPSNAGSEDSYGEVRGFRVSLTIEIRNTVRDLLSKTTASVAFDLRKLAGAKGVDRINN